MRLTFAAIVFTLMLSVVCNGAELTQDSLSTVKKNVDEKKAVLVDVREKKEWDAGHVEGAIFLPLSELQHLNADQAKKKLPTERILYVHCVVGKRAVTAGAMLEKLGYEVRSLKPGYKELVNAGFKSVQ